MRSDGPQQWWVEPDPDRVEVRPLPPRGELQPGSFARVEMPAATLFLVCWGQRVPATSAVTGGTALFDHWLSLLGW